MEELREQLIETAKDTLEEAKKLEVGSKEYMDAVKASMELADRAIAMDKAANELEEKAKIREEDRVEKAKIREEERAEKAKIREEERVERDEVRKSDRAERTQVREDEKAEKKKHGFVNTVLDGIKYVVVPVALFAIGKLIDVKTTEKCLNWEQSGNFASSQITKDRVRDTTNSTKTK